MVSRQVKLYCSVNRGKAMYQLAYYLGGRRVQKNFADKAEAKRVANQILGGLTNNAEAVEALASPSLLIRLKPSASRLNSSPDNLLKLHS